MDDAITTSFNLWTQPWITFETIEGKYQIVGLRDALLNSQAYRTIVTTSPLEVVGLFRLLAALLTDIYEPKSFEELNKIRSDKRFSEDRIVDFVNKYGHRFDLFSVDNPFMQSNDLPLKPTKGDNVKTVAYLAPEYPSGTAVVHYHHWLDEDHYFCPACAAKGLTAIPAFATSGGAGIKPSINGVPPMYVIPCGETLFESLLFSVVLPPYRPGATASSDQPWWRGSGFVGRSQEVAEVGYLHSLTFPARRVRLHPYHGNIECTRCGQLSDWGVKTMVFDMGQCRPEGAPFWQDPFTGYVQKGDKAPIPIRPSAGKASWREFGGLFLQKRNGESQKFIRPSVINQIDDWFFQSFPDQAPLLTFRCVGLRTDMKAKVFEWIDTGFDVPSALLRSEDAALDVDDAITFSSDCEKGIADVFQNALNRNKGSRYAHLKAEMRNHYWDQLAMPFRNWVLNLGRIYAQAEPDLALSRKDVLLEWYKQSVDVGLASIVNCLQELGDDGHSLSLRYTAENNARRRLFGQLKKEREKYE